jgi:hypothetical protein
MSEQRTLWGHIRTFLIVTLITVMVWLLAESRMVMARSVEAQIALIPADSAGGGSLVVRQNGNGPQIRTVSIHVEGSTAGLDRFARVLQNRVELRVGREIPAKPGVHVLDLQSILRQSSDFAVHGLTITEVSPDSISVEVDELETREFPIRVNMPAGIDIDGAPRAEPASVRIVAPSRKLAEIAAQVATVQIDQADIEQLTPGRIDTIPGVIVDIEGVARTDWETTIDPGQVDVLVTLRSQTQRYVIDRMPIQILMSPGEVGDWRVEIDEADKDWVNVEIAGPADGIDQLRSGDSVLTAFVTLTFEDLERSISSKQTQIQGLPAGCVVVSPDFTVNLEISRVEPATPSQTDPESANPND